MSTPRLMPFQPLSMTIAQLAAVSYLAMPGTPTTCTPTSCDAGSTGANTTGVGLAAGAVRADRVFTAHYDVASFAGHIRYGPPIVST